MNADQSECVALEKLPTEIGAPVPVCNALLRSGLLGYNNKWGVQKESIEHYKNYLTQWRNDLSPRRYPLNQIPVPKNLSGGDQPVLTRTETIIAPGTDPAHEIEKDTGWLAHFYLRPNPFFFPNPTDMGLIGPVPVKLKKRQESIYNDFPVHVCPDPDCRLALIVVEGLQGTERDPFECSYEIVQSILREITFLADVPLPIAQSFIVGVPSGVIDLQFPKPAKEVDFEELKIQYSNQSHVKLDEAKSLYWEALATNNPFFRFLSFWRIYELVKKARQEWCKINKRADTKIVEEKLPNMWVWSKYSGKSFEQVRQELRRPFRDALAHADGKLTEPRTPLRAADLSEVAAHVPTVRYIARVVIQNLEATFNS